MENGQRLRSSGCMARICESGSHVSFWIKTRYCKGDIRCLQWRGEWSRMPDDIPAHRRLGDGSCRSTFIMHLCYRTILLVYCCIVSPVQRPKWWSTLSGCCLEWIHRIIGDNAKMHDDLIEGATPCPCPSSTLLPFARSRERPL